MQSLVLNGIKEIETRNVEIPVIQHPLDAIIKISVAGLCGSDMHVYHGRETCQYGTIMGHEVVGIIHDIGNQVTNFSKGQRVVVPFTTNCGNCYYCSRNLTMRCQNGQLLGYKDSNGVGLHGGQAEFIRIPMADATLVQVPDNISNEHAVFAADILCTGFYCATSANVKECESVLVVGCGPVGLMAIAACLHLNPKCNVFAVDKIKERVLLASKLGAVAIQLESNEQVLEFIKSKTNGLGVNSAIEIVGAKQATRLAFECLQKCGTLVSNGCQYKTEICFDAQEAYDKSITFKSGRCPARVYSKTAFEMIESNAAFRDMLTNSIITHRLKLKDGPEAYKIFDEKRNGCIKILFFP